MAPCADPRRSAGALCVGRSVEVCGRGGSPGCRRRELRLRPPASGGEVDVVGAALRESGMPAAWWRRVAAGVARLRGGWRRACSASGAAAWWARMAAAWWARVAAGRR